MARGKRKELRRIDLDSIKDPTFLHELSYKELDLLAADLRKAILEATSKYGGHLSSNLGVVELTIALHRTFDFRKDKLIFDVGHQCYAHKILTGRPLEGLRTKEGLSGFQKRRESPYDIYEAGHSSTSISAAAGFARARDLKGEKFDIVPVIGDASIVSGLAFEGLNNLAHSRHKVIIVLNDNGMSISKPVGGLSKMFARISTAAGYNRMKASYSRGLSKTKIGTRFLNFTRKVKNSIRGLFVPTTFFDDMGFVYVGPVDGHNIKALEKALKRAKNTYSSCVVHVLTAKGKGYSPAEEDTTGYWHGVSPFDIETGKPKDMHPGLVSWSHVYSDLALDVMKRHPETILITPGTQKGSGLDQIFHAFPERSIDVGIAEEHAFTMAGGLALSGYHPIISIYSTFLQRSYDEVSHDIARMNIPVSVLVDRSGFVGADGETHQGLYDAAFLRSIPNVVISMPGTIRQAKVCLEESLNDHGGPFFIRLPRAFVAPDKEGDEPAPGFGKWPILRTGNTRKTAVVGVGPLFLDLKRLIAEKDIDVTLVEALYLLPFDEEALDFLLSFGRIIVYDPYSIDLGLAVPLVARLQEKGYQGKFKVLSAPTEFVNQAKMEEQLAEFGLLPADVLKLL